MKEKEKVQSFFGRHAAGYSRSESHRTGADLRLLLDRLELGATDRALDVGTGVGHTALALGPSVRQVVGLDLTPGMGGEFIANRREAGAENLLFVVGDVEGLPFPDGGFDVVTCRRSAHHFPDPPRAVAEMARVLRSGGYAGIVDMTTPEDRAAAALLNAMEKARDSSHARALPPSEWEEVLGGGGLAVETLEVILDRVPWEIWVRPVRAGGEEDRQARRVLEAADPGVREKVAEVGPEGCFVLKRRIVVVARKR
ncbi:MAG: class I SAM-dependent methyltransferase [Planctomycetota bacterium]